MMRDEQAIPERIAQFANVLPRRPDGKIDYAHAAVAPVMTLFVQHGGEILLLKRSGQVSTYKGKWNAVAGYLDELKPFRHLVLEELEEETGIREQNIASLHMGKPYEFTDKKINKTWIVHPILVTTKEKPEIQLNWEHDTYRWIRPEELGMFDTVPMLKQSWKHASQ